VGPPSLPTPSSIHLPPGVYRTREVVLLPGAVGPVPLQRLDPAPLHLFTSGVYRTGEVVLLPGAVGPMPLECLDSAPLRASHQPASLKYPAHSHPLMKKFSLSSRDIKGSVKQI
jgi:hypothetical protein